MAFTEEERNAIGFLRKMKNYSARRFLKEFPEKGWSRGGLDKLLRKVDETGSVKRRAGSGRPRDVRTDKIIADVEQLVLSQEDHPQTHRTQREISRDLNISQSSVRDIIKKDLKLKCFKKRRATELTEENKAARLQRSRLLLKRYPAHMVNFIWFTDEKLFNVATPRNNQNYRLYAKIGTCKCDIGGKRLLRLQPTFSKSIMVSVGVSSLGQTSVHFIEPGMKINGAYYRDVLLKQNLLPDIRALSELFIFQQDGAPAHRARETVQFLERETPAFIPPTLWPPNSPDLNPVDYAVWGVMVQKVYRSKIRDVTELKQRILDAWNELHQTTIDGAIAEWRKRLRACVSAKGGNFEHKLK
jgi:transposase